MLKVTLDHNCIIHLERKTETGQRIQSIIENQNYKCFIVNIGASELQKNGISPDHYEKFEELLITIGIDELERLDPMGLFDVTFFDRCILADDKMIELADKISEILFRSDADTINKVYDIHTLWCHIFYKNDVFLTCDTNFTKATKLPRLLALGAGRVCQPEEL